MLKRIISSICVAVMLSISTAARAQQDNYNGIKSVTASSTLAPQGYNTYYPSNLINDDEDSCWAAHFTGKPISLTFNMSGWAYSNISIFNGYIKTEKSYYNNARAKKVDLYINGKFLKTVTLGDDFWSQTTISFGREYKIHTFKMVIKSVYPGRKYQDVCISGIQFN